MKIFLPNNIKWLILGLLSQLFISCNLFPCGWTTDLNEINDLPTVDLLVGTYRLDDRTLNSIPGYKNAKSAKLTLKKDGSLEITNTPIGTFDFMDYYDETGKKVNADGKWNSHKGKYTAELSVDLNFEEKFSELDFSTTWEIYEKDRKPVIFIILGDPDSCAAARFIKISE